jgi:non-lysosomal glucosylceramidase
MSSWSLLLALSGYEYDGPERSLRFAPRVTPENFKSFFCAPESWGSLHQTREARTQRNQITVHSGRLALAQLRLSPPGPATKVTLTLAGNSVPARSEPRDDGLLVTLVAPITIQSGGTLEIVLS